MQSELHLFVIWENGRPLADKILADIARKFQIKQVYDMSWPRSHFAANLAKFYGKRLPRSCRKERECGTGHFLVIVVNDLAPRYYMGLNFNVCDAKNLYRTWLGGNLLHASDHKAEGIANLEMLTGKSAADFALSHPGKWDGEIRNHHANPAHDGLENKWWRAWLNKLHTASRQLLQNLNLW